MDKAVYILAILLILALIAAAGMGYMYMQKDEELQQYTTTEGLKKLCESEKACPDCPSPDCPALYHIAVTDSKRTPQDQMIVIDHDPVIRKNSRYPGIDNQMNRTLFKLIPTNDGMMYITTALHNSIYLYLADDMTVKRKGISDGDPDLQLPQYKWLFNGRSLVNGRNGGTGIVVSNDNYFQKGVGGYFMAFFNKF